MPQFPSGPDLKLRVDVSQVPFDGARTEEQAGADLGVREPIAGKFGDLAFLGGEDVPWLGDALIGRLDKDADKILAALAKAADASVLSRPTDAGGEYSILCPRPKLMDAIAALRAAGSDAPATTQDADYVFDTANPLYASLASALG